MAASWTFFLDDANGSALCELSTASGRSISYRRNSYSEATFTISHEDAAATLLTGALAAGGVPTLRAYRWTTTATAGVLQFRGYLAALQNDAEELSLMTCTFRSPFGRLLGNGSDGGRFLSTAAQYAATDAGDIALQLIELANADGATGLSTALERAHQTSVPPTFSYTKVRDRRYSIGTNVGQAIINLSNVLDGFDFSENYVEGTGGTLAQFVIVAQQGVDNPASRFEYGPATMANVAQVSSGVSPPVNRCTVIGANNLVGVKNDLGSQTKYGLWPMQQSSSDVSEQATLDDKAQALLRPNPVQTIAFTPEYGAASCPQFFDDFNLGDTVRFFARRGALNVDASVRVNAATVAVTDDGNESVEVQDPTTPEEDSIIRAQLQVEVTTA